MNPRADSDPTILNLNALFYLAGILLVSCWYVTGVGTGFVPTFVMAEEIPVFVRSFINLIITKSTVINQIRIPICFNEECFGSSGK